MDPLDNNIVVDEDVWKELFPDGNFSSIFDATNLSNGLQLHDPNLYQVLLPLAFADTNNESSSIIDDNSAAEINRILADSLHDNGAMLDERQSFEPIIMQQNHDAINFPTPQKAIGNQNGILYLLDASIINCISGGMSVKQQPKANNRLNYVSEGTRFLPDSKYHPVAINLPNLQSIALSNNAKFGIVITIVTDEINGQTIVHANDIVCDVNDAVKIGYGCVFVPLKNRAIENNEETYRRLGIEYKTCNEYTFDLTPFNKSSMFGITEKYTSKNKKNVTNAAKGSDFKKDYKLSSYKLVFQLGIKEDNIVYISDISCETEIIDELKAREPRGKRPASFATEIYSNKDSSSDIQISSRSKKFKASTSQPLVGLPVIKNNRKSGGECRTTTRSKSIKRKARSNN